MNNKRLGRMSIEQIEEFFELSGKFLVEGYNKDSADALATCLMINKYSVLKTDDFKELENAQPASV